jgi:uncharacterized protein YcbK (DUF882 family)
VRDLSDSELSNVRDLTGHAKAHVMQLLALVPELRVSSGRRTPERNRAVGGSPRSFHLAGRAADLSGDRAAVQHGFRHALATRPVEIIDEGDHLHVAW